ncbi:MAG: type III pantothenate kinase [Deltaproteobacteria bacterium]|nr:type III pantothenate kinase [Deltaproteobacteria bacterium]
MTPLLAIDVGNTNLAFGLYVGGTLAAEWCLPTRRDCSVAALIDGMRQGLHGTRPTAAAIASVVPPLDPALRAAAREVTGSGPLIVDHTNAGIAIAYSRPAEIGADRLADAAGALAKYGVPCLIVDFGTATTFEYLDAEGRYHGGPIVPGVALMNDALASAAAKIAPTPLAVTERLLPTSTTEAVQAGVYHGYVGLTRYLIAQLLREIGGAPRVIATGGLASLIVPACPAIAIHDPRLTLDGLRAIWAKNSTT